MPRIPVIVATLDDEFEDADGIVAQGCIPADGQACPVPSVDAARNEQRRGVPDRGRQPKDRRALEARPQVHQPRRRDLGVPPVASPEKFAEPPSGRFLSEFERIRIADLLRVRSSFREIGRQLGRSSGTITRDVNRNSDADGVYHPHAAHQAAVERRARPQERKLADDGELRRFVAERLAKRWSPEQVSQALRIELPDRDDMHACADTIYQAIYRPESELRRRSPRPLCTGRLRRHRHRQARRTNRFVEPMTMIDQRPVDVEDREMPGHWESQ